MIRLEYKDGKLVIPFEDLVPLMELPEKLVLIDRLACEEDVIKDVMDQILQGSTDSGSSGAESCGLSFHPSSIERARRRIAVESDWCIAKEMERLETMLETAKKKIKELEDTHYYRPYTDPNFMSPIED